MLVGVEKCSPDRKCLAGQGSVGSGFLNMSFQMFFSPICGLFASRGISVNSHTTLTYCVHDLVSQLPASFGGARAIDDLDV